MMRYLILTISILLPAHADFRITTINTSYHYDQSENRNESHNGFGFEFITNDILWVGFNRFTNSDNRDSNLVYVSTEKNYLDTGFFYGLTIGRADNYNNNEGRSIAGVTMRYKIIKTTITPDLAAVGFTIEF